MWAFLKTLRAEGFQFRRQVPFKGYFLDFVCHSRRLVIEVDGASHACRSEHDARRDAVLATEGYRTMRFQNAAIRDEMDGVSNLIREALNARPLPPLHGEEQPRSGQGGARSSVRTPPGLASLNHPPHEGEGE